MPRQTPTFILALMIAFAVYTTGCGDLTLPEPADDPVSAEMPEGGQTPSGEPKPAVCGDQALSDREVCADDSYDAYVSCSMTCGGTGNACENSICPADCMAGWVDDLEACDAGWPECGDDISLAETVLPEGFACLAARYECQANLGECTDAGLAACTAAHFACVEAG